MIATVKKFIARLTQSTALEPIKIDLSGSMYRKTHNLGGDRITNADEIYMLLWAQQFRPMRIGVRTVQASYCAYRGLGAPLRVKPSVGIAIEGSSYVSNLDHIVPRSLNGEEHVLNYQLLASWYNSISFKGGLPTFHARWHAFRKGGDIDGLPFAELADVFLWVFDNFHKDKSLRYMLPNDMCFAWPWWAREVNAPYRPILHGYDEKNHVMRASKEESYLSEWSALAHNVINYTKATKSTAYAATVRQTFEDHYRMTPEVLASFAGRV